MVKSRFTQADVSRAVAGAVKAGMTVSGVEITSDGTIRLIAPHAKPDQADERKPKEW